MMTTRKTNNQPCRLGVVIPLANEENTVVELLDRILQQLDAGDFIFCIVDNASCDTTKDLVSKQAETDHRIRLVWAPENRCVVDAYFRGYSEAFEAGCKWILEMDGGLSHTPEEIGKFIAEMEKGIDFAAGSRFVKGGHFSGPIKRLLISYLGTVLVNATLGTRMKDMTSGFQCFSRAALKLVLENKVKSRAHFFQTEIRYMLHDWAWVEVPISYRNPSNRLDNNSVMEAFSVLWDLTRRKNRFFSGMDGRP